MPSKWSDLLDRHRAELRERILAAALELLRERGMAGLTMSALAERAEISRATLYHHFPDIDAVLAAWVGAEIERSLEVLMREAAQIPAPLDRLQYLVDAQLTTFASHNHRLSADLFESEASPPSIRREVAARMAPLRQMLATTIDEAKAAGAFAPDVDTPLAADLVLGLLGAARRSLVAGTIEPGQAKTAIMRLLEAGWASRPR
jgi:AcrR family transcriptional regulator